jgi:RNA polymerase sigma-70 factor (ECF subfamily)
MLRINRDMDIELIENCKRGDRLAQQQLYNQFSPKMLAVCRRYISGTAEAEDVLIKGFLIVFENIRQFRNEGSFEGWIRKIMVNEALSVLRRQKSLFLYSEIEVARMEADDLNTDSTLLTGDLLNLVAALPDGYRAVFNLYAIEGYSHREIAAMLGITEATSKSQLSRAREVLRSRLYQTGLTGTKKFLKDGKSN